jgi:hypothetical protein
MRRQARGLFLLVSSLVQLINSPGWRLSLCKRNMERLARPVPSAETVGGHSDNTAKCGREMSVAGETGIESDLGYPVPGPGQLGAGIVDPQTPQIRTDGQTRVPTEFAAKVDGMDARFDGEDANGERVAKPVVDEVAD